MDRDRVGSVLDGKWTLERVLGRGGMGVVYAACDPSGGRAAVKILHPALARMPEVRERFRREGYAANRVEHRGAVKMLADGVLETDGDYGEHGEASYIVMELLEGESLEARLASDRVPSSLELLAILDSVLDVLDAAHRRGVLHRDLKPANLFLTESGDPLVKVLDFGLARLEELRGATAAGQALGTPSYMAPELAAGRTADVDARTDLFALGATAFVVLAGRPVHEAASPVQLVLKMASTPAPSVRSVAPHASSSVARIVDRALAFRREDRYPDAATMRADVAAAIELGITRP